MKTINLILLFICSFVISAQAQWQLVGMQDFSSAGAENQSLATYNGTPYVAFKDFSNNLKTTVMKFDGTSWIAVGTAGFSGGLAEKQNLVISSTGVPYVAYSDYANTQKVTVKKFNGTTWVTVGTGGITANHQSYSIDLALDNNDNPYVAYTESGTGLTIKKFNGSTWVDVGSNIPDVYNTTLDFDLNNDVYMCGEENSSAIVYKLFGSTWSSVGSSSVSVGTAWYISFVIDTSGTPYVAYNDVPFANKLTVMKFDGSSWVSVGNPGFTSSQVFYPVVRIDNDNIPYVAYKANGNITVMKYVGNSWVNVGQPSFALASVSNADFEIDNGIPYVVYEHISTSKATVMKYTMPSTIQQLEVEEGIFEISPNPVKNILKIRTEKEIQEINIHNLNGQLLKSTSKNSISVFDLPQGVYIVELRTLQGVSYKQFVKE